MSFAQMSRGFGGGLDAGCDCDECGPASSIRQVVPAPIQDAIDRYKRQKRETGSIKRTQDRTLIKRGDANVALWNWTMPNSAEPLLEFGNSHRLIWIKRLPGRLYSIGSGIVGSEAEEKNRTVMDQWEEGSVIYVPSNGGRAVGWIHKDEATKTPEGDATEERRGGPAILVIAKIPADCCLNTSEDDDSCSWTRSLIALCRKYLGHSPTKMATALSELDGKVAREVMG
jgi:hypothetical protein